MTTRPSSFFIRALKIQSAPGKNSKSMTVSTKIMDGEKIVKTKALID